MYSLTETGNKTAEKRSCIT